MPCRRFTESVERLRIAPAAISYSTGCYLVVVVWGVTWNQGSKWSGAVVSHQGRWLRPRSEL